METNLSDLLKKSTKEDNVENLLKVFFSQHIPLSCNIMKLQRRGRYKEALLILRNNKYKLVNECFFIHINIITSILEGILKAENVRKEKRYELIFIWFEPFFEDKWKITESNSVGRSCSDEKDDKEDESYSRGKVSFRGIYLSEWVMTSLNRIFSSVVFPSRGISVENWVFVLDLLKFVYVGRNVLSSYLREGADTKGCVKNEDEVVNVEEFSNVEKSLSLLTDRTSCEGMEDGGFCESLEKYYGDPRKTAKSYFSLPFALFRCITSGLQKDDERRKLQVYKHIIPSTLSEDGFYKKAIKTCVSSWVQTKSDRMNYEKVVHITKRIVNLNMQELFCQRMVCILLGFGNSVGENSSTQEGSEHVSYSCIPISDEEGKTQVILRRINNIFERMFYYIHMYCNGDIEGKLLISSLLRSLIPMVKVVQHYQYSNISLCLYNKNVEIILITIVNILFLYQWNSFFLEKFFYAYSNVCLPLPYALAVVNIVNLFIDSQPRDYSLSPFSGFEEKKHLIHSRVVVDEKRPYDEIVSKVEMELCTVGIKQNGMDLKIQQNGVDLLAVSLLRDILFCMLNQFTEGCIEEMKKRIFVSTLLSKLLYTFSVHMKKINKKIVKNCYTFDVLTEREKHIYKINTFNVNIFERVTSIIQRLFKAHDEISLYCGQVIAENFKHYVDSQTVKGENMKNFKKRSIQVGEVDSQSSDDELLMFPNLKKQMKSLPEEVQCFSLIRQRRFSYLDSLLPAIGIKKKRKSGNPKNREKGHGEYEYEEVGQREDDKGENPSLIELIPQMDNTCEKREKLEKEMMIKNAEWAVENSLYNSRESEFIVKLEQEHAHYLNVECNKYMYLHPSEDLFECLGRLKCRATYIQRNVEESNHDILKLNEKRENYEEENFRICQTVVALPRLIKKSDVLSYLSVQLYEVLISLDNMACAMNKSKHPFAIMKMFVIILLSINSPVDIGHFVFANLYSNVYSPVQKMLMLLSLQFAALFLSGRITLWEVFECASGVARRVTLTSGGDIVDGVEAMQKKGNDRIGKDDLFNIAGGYYDLFERYPQGRKCIRRDVYKSEPLENPACGKDKFFRKKRGKLRCKRETSSGQMEEQVWATTPCQHGDEDDPCNSTTSGEISFSPEGGHEGEDEGEIEEGKGENGEVKSHSRNNAHLCRMNSPQPNEYKTRLFLSLCNFFFNNAYTKLLCLNSKREIGSIDYDEYKLRNCYAKDATLTVSLISSYTLFFNCSCDSYFYIDDILADGFSIGNFFIRNKNFLVRRVSVKLIFHMISLILKRRKIFMLKNENYVDVITYISNNVTEEHDDLSLCCMRRVLALHESFTR
ncbi:conserved Plasmodium protein, unknown function [Plasmodium ovale]|uniref:Telomere length regulation protein conserved domain-containing protein n=2 Tax=Plasmodium ovale TaxID=36330 RepID=A0A1A8VRA0_PLAOA|nr:conserved Plasmodium protein, unknown function [Plasmodium ovale curtisi]SBS84798.1 conserved Plasmodium protein, unknown function [Plasmodium ovale curtisi]SCQ16060.1 conserved Plasmodium protein, unknown function [Plasmodium ovale]